MDIMGDGKESMLGGTCLEYHQESLSKYLIGTE